MKRLAKPVIFIALMLMVLSLSYRYDLRAGFMSLLPALRDTVSQSPIKAGVIYIIATSAGCVLLALPGAAFAMIAGVLFEPLTGTLLCIVAATLGAVLAFLAGRYFLRDSVRPMLERNALLRRFLIEDVEHSGVILLMVTRLVPLFPYNLQNFAYGLTDIKLVPYALYTFLFMAPGAAAFTLGAAGITSSERRGLYLMIALALAVIVMMLGMFLRKRFVRQNS